MNANTVRTVSPLFESQVIEFVPSKEPKLKKDGTPKNTKNNKQRGKKSEVYPFQIEDLRKMTVYFHDNEMWQCYLIFVLSTNMARRIGDTLELKWKHFYNEKTGELRSDQIGRAHV